MRNTKIIEIDINKNKDKITRCFTHIINLFNKNNIVYWIEYGTLLGAVREGGFIPWDSEIDIGIWYDDYKKHAKYIDEELKSMGFIIDKTSNDRVKLIHKDIMNGAYTIDIHTYHFNDNYAFVSYNVDKWSILERIVKFVTKNNKWNKYPYYEASKIIKLIMDKEGIISDKYYIVDDSKYDKHLFRVGVDKKRLHSNKKKNSINYILLLVKKLTYYICKINIIYRISKNMEEKYIRKNKKKMCKNNDKQAIPIRYYKNLTHVSFEGIDVLAPKDYYSYLEEVYGKEWYIRNSKWHRSQNKINKKESQIM
ncbi:LicD family protein [Natronogracilivirga saccharolytica]|uniref:LicD family protein n=1 Tax=Natronogracilivirga saccharolytica TaxID=2812953 RepID=A0A8J7RN35_9BACT|nr:LicD family protein [Natronogracilivirga saccharolytica]MBP3194025.1 LicD family protein [Natronogracilivirga saccharolytica]